MTPEEILLKAADVIQRDGWHQGALFEGSNKAPTPQRDVAAREAPVCALGAISRATWGSCSSTGREYLASVVAAEADATCLLLKQVEASTAGRYPSIPMWNDAPERSAEDVILALKRAAADG
ncbi:DUF6197 family protein [Streptomyces griseus]|uniref:DUF6197 family protein n=1 Tax=Streptomyces griseus TaxID=1911 RepID=UPI0033F29D5C